MFKLGLPSFTRLSKESAEEMFAQQMLTSLGTVSRLFAS